MFYPDVWTEHLQKLEITSCNFQILIFQFIRSKPKWDLAKAGKILMIPDELVVSKIYLIRGQKVMIDNDLADLYDVETERL